MQLTPEQMTLLFREGIKDSEQAVGFAILAHPGIPTAGLIFSDKSLQYVEVGDANFMKTIMEDVLSIGGVIHFDKQGKFVSYTSQIKPDREKLARAIKDSEIRWRRNQMKLVSPKE